MAKPVVVVTGVSGNLGSRLLPLLKSYSVIGVDLNPPRTDTELQFESLDLGQESSTRTFYELLRDTHAYAVIHLAFVIDPVDVDHTTTIIYTMVRPEVAGRASRDDGPNIPADAASLIARGGVEDNDMSEGVQRGLRAGANTFLEFGRHESAIGHFHANLAARLSHLPHQQ